MEKEKTNVIGTATPPWVSNFEETKTRILYKARAEQDRIFEYALRNVAEPPVKGKITRGKIRWRGIRLVVKDQFGKHERWLEQRGKRISPVIVIETVYKRNDHA